MERRAETVVREEEGRAIKNFRGYGGIYLDLKSMRFLSGWPLVPQVHTKSMKHDVYLRATTYISHRCEVNNCFPSSMSEEVSE